MGTRSKRRPPWRSEAGFLWKGRQGTRDANRRNDPEHLSLSRLNHRLPRSQAHPEIMQGTAQFHHQIADALLPQADPVLHDATTLDAAVDMLDPESPLVEHLVGQVLLQGE